MNAKKNFVEDTGGAILIAGVFMTLFLIGGLFFLLGIGQALVFHDHMQEAADASAFTGAVVHARFMNMIVAINIIMLALVAIHLVLALAHLVTLIANVLACSVACILPPVLAACNLTIVANKASTIALELYDTALKGLLLGLSKFQYGLAWTAWLASPAASAFVVKSYKSGPGGSTVIGLSEGLSIPGLNSGKIGLPVKEEEPGFLCEKLVSYFTIPGLSALGISGGVRTLFCSSKFDWVIHYDKCIVPTKGPGLATNGGWWTDKSRGPKHMWEYEGTPLGNGSDWNSVYGTALPEYTEQAEKSVAVGGAAGAAGSGWGADNSYTNKAPYIAQAEFYYDCTKTWTKPECEDKPKIDNAMYTFGWRARLVRFHLPRVSPIGAVATVLNKVVGLVIIH